MMLDMSQTNIGEALGITFQQVQKYEKGTNRIGASRLQQIAHVLQGLDGRSHRIILARNERISTAVSWAMSRAASASQVWTGPGI
jgi:transcriptional regulator with XRE-family HTH domain